MKKKKNTCRDQVNTRHSTHTHARVRLVRHFFLVGSIVVQFLTVQKYVRFAFVSHIRLKLRSAYFASAFSGTHKREPGIELSNGEARNAKNLPSSTIKPHMLLHREATTTTKHTRLSTRKIRWIQERRTERIYLYPVVNNHVKHNKKITNIWHHLLGMAEFVATATECGRPCVFVCVFCALAKTNRQQSLCLLVANIELVHCTHRITSPCIQTIC